MGAECDKHGCDLVGHEFSEGGLHCAECKLEERAERAEAAARDFAGVLRKSILAGPGTAAARIVENAGAARDALARHPEFSEGTSE